MRRIIALTIAGLSVAGFHAGVAAEPCNTRVLVISAFPGEIDPLLREATLEPGSTVTAEGRRFFVGTLRGNDVVLALTGIGLVNAEATARLAMDLFPCGDESGITSIVFSGVSGGTGSIGDVAVPARWTLDEDHWFEADPAMRAVVDDVVGAGSIELARAVPAGDPACVGLDPRLIETVQLEHVPEIILHGDGRSSDPFGGRAFPCFPAGGDVFGCEPCRAPIQPPDVPRFVTGAIPFVDPDFFFGYFESPPAIHGYDAEDMETAAVAAVAAEQGIPFVAFRALSDGEGDPLMLPGFPFQFFYYRQIAAENAAAVALAFLDAWAVV